MRVKCFRSFERGKPWLRSSESGRPCMVEKSSERKVKTLRSDNGGEYILNEFEMYLIRERDQT